jgi:hypothetical protein
MLIRNKSKAKQKYSKYEEVIIKTILANKILERSFFNENECIDWRREVNDIYNSEDFDGDEVLAQFIVSGSYDNNVQYKSNSFIPTNIGGEIDSNIDKKFMTNDDFLSKNNANGATVVEEVSSEEVSEDSIDE